MQVSIRISNIAEIRRAFALAPGDMANQLQRAIRKATFQVGRQSRINTPVLTGRLRASHTERFQPGKGIIEPTAHYAIYVHEGTRYMRARPFLAEAVDSETGQVQDFFTEAVKEVFDRIGRRA